MNQRFAPLAYVRVADGTLVSAFLNSTDALGGSHQALGPEVSVAAGIIEAGAGSKIHIMPFVTQITWVNAGNLKVRMKDAGSPAPYTIELGPQQACITQPGTFLQLLNPGAEPCHTLYVVSPSYVVEVAADGRVIYDDAMMVDSDWENLGAAGWQLGLLGDLAALAKRREQALQRLAGRKVEEGSKRGGP
ncbi:MAG: hypothetical protein U1F68_10475 [Gammaproteobacteria bacterium]